MKNIRLKLSFLLEEYKNANIFALIFYLGDNGVCSFALYLVALITETENKNKN